VLRILVILAAMYAPAQTPPAEGITPQWDVRQQMKELADAARRTGPVLANVKPEEWVERGAPAAYTRQTESLRNEVAALIASSEKLAADPERLSIGLETYFRMGSLERLGGSLAEGIRKYQSGALADRLVESLALNSANREVLRQHLTDLAAAAEQQFAIVSEEAQRCRAEISRETEPPVRRPGRR
jgi:hypothetical protein